MKLFTKIVNGLKVDLQLAEEPKMECFGQLDEYRFTKAELKSEKKGVFKCAPQR